MFVAKNRTGLLIDIDVAVTYDKSQYFCPHCNGEVIIKNGITTDEDEYQRIFQQNYELFKVLGEEHAKQAAKIAADKQCGNKYHDIIKDLKIETQTTDANIAHEVDETVKNDIKTAQQKYDLEKAVKK